MKNLNKHTLSIFLASALLFTACERDMDEDLPLATYATTAEVFTDAPVDMGSDFYLPYANAKADAWSVDDTEGYDSSSSMRIDVPNADDADGSYAGGILRIDGDGRDLSGYNALTFYAKASQGVTIDVLGFGTDYIDNAYTVSIDGGVELDTTWEKVIIPIPDPSKLTNERGVFEFAAGTSETDGTAYTFWIDEVKFENLGTIGQPRPMIQSGSDDTTTGVNGSEISVTGLTETFNLGTGEDVTINVAPAYYEFSSSDSSVASVDEEGSVSIISSGTTVITATLGGEDATGSLTVNSAGDFTHAPTPTQDADDVIAIYSDAYDCVDLSFTNGYWQPYQTTESADFEIEDDHVLNYTSFNFVGIQTSATFDATDMDYAHIDLYFPEAMSSPSMTITLKDFGADGADGGGDDTTQAYSVTDFTVGSWVSIDIPLTTARSAMSQFILEGENIDNFYVDNFYFYTDGGSSSATTPTTAAPTPTEDAANVISIFSDTYTDITDVDYNPGWGQTTVYSTEDIAGNSTIKLSSLNYQGIDFSSNSQDVSSMDYVHIDYWTEDSSAFNFYIISNDGTTTVDSDAYAATVPTNGSWTSVDIPLSSTYPNVDLANIIQMKFDGDGTIYIDNIYFYTDSGSSTATEPTTAAPTPTEDAANVISIFSDAYTDITGVDYNPGWGQTTVYSTEDIDGNSTIKLSSLNYQGIDFSSNTQDVSGLTYVHIDYWTADSSAFNFYVISNDGTTTVDSDAYAATVPTNGSWTSVDIPLSSTYPNVDLANVFQMKFDGDGTIYIDNIYFY